MIIRSDKFTAEVDHPDRVFQLWAFTVGMGLLLLRSVKSPTFGSRIDVLFQDVQALKLPTHLDGLTVSRVPSDETVQITSETGLLPEKGCIFFALSGSAYRGYVVAGVMVTSEDTGEYFEPSEWWPPRPGPRT